MYRQSHSKRGQAHFLIYCSRRFSVYLYGFSESPQATRKRQPSSDTSQRLSLAPTGNRWTRRRTRPDCSRAIKFLSVDGSKVSDFMQIIEKIAIGSGRTANGSPKAVLEIQRGADIFPVEVFPELIKTNPSSGDEIRMIGISPAMTYENRHSYGGSPAKAGGRNPAT